MERDNAAAEAFWRFSLMVYSRPAVATGMLALQDRGGHNVNLILFALWLAVSGRGRLDGVGLARARAAITPLDTHVVAPLRRMRRELKTDPERDVQALRRRILALEITCERDIQARLAATLAARGDAEAGGRRATAEANLELVLGADFRAPEAGFLAALVAELVLGTRPDETLSGCAC